jgi:ferredoxin
MIQFPSTLDRNNYCNLCGDCVKACPHENLTLRIRPFGQDIASNWRQHLDEAFLAIALVGLTVVVTGHMIEPWHDWMDAMTAWIPWETLGIYDHETVEKWSFSLIYVSAILIVSPLLLLGSSAVATRLASGQASLNSTFRTYAYMFIPVGIGLHLAHNLLHLLKEGAGIVPVLQRTAAKYTSFNLGIPNWNVPVIVPDIGIYWLQMGTLIIFYGASLYLGYRIALRSCPDRTTAVRTIIPMVVLSLAFTLFNIFLLSQPMAARHSH